jgi:hypothetical protein
VDSSPGSSGTYAALLDRRCQNRLCTTVSCRYSLEELLAVVGGLAPAKVDALSAIVATLTMAPIGRP